jgi:hypothetical protein
MRDANDELAIGYGYLLRAWAAPLEHRRRWGASIALWSAWTHFNAAILLARGENPWKAGPTLVDSKAL